MSEPQQPLTTPAQPTATAANLTSVAKGAVGAIPLVGAIGAEVIDRLVKDPMNVRQQQFLEDISGAIEELREKVYWQSLVDDPSFSATVAAVLQAVTRTADAEKLAALKAAAVSSALPGCPEEHLRLRFIQAVDELSPSHIDLLRKVEQQDIMTAGEAPAVPVSPVLGSSNGLSGKFGCPSDVDSNSWLTLLLGDLRARGLVARYAMPDAQELGSLLSGGFGPDPDAQWSISTLGELFLGFLKSESAE